MKLAMAVIGPLRLHEVREAPAPLGLQGRTATEARGFGRQERRTATCRCAEDQASVPPEAQIGVAVPAVEATATAARTGRVFVLDVAHAPRIHTGGTGGTVP